ncbi:hypothetical protein RHSIM_Rhsim07G0078800 [Rhododendron simsii]|uniref:CS domain-containing protein n=1 Tax=Rhododendron simsii TaxID=118357 RepID=A0A834GRS2_RHOSS|nr:hypothetical protein RHSIM_Rhsim07G0078800 [Rhododendron simsii]
MEFCTRISTQLMLKEIDNDRNIVTSPLSINVVLNMVAAGSKGGGLDYMLRILGSKNIDEINFKSSEMMAVAAGVIPVAKGGGPSNNAEDGPTVAMVNGVWVDERFPLKPSYKELIRSVHKCEAKTVDFLNKSSEVINEINAWADDASRGLIKDVLQPGSLGPGTTIVLGNGLYLKGLWDCDYKFDASRTENRNFYLSSGNTVLVPFMTSHKKYCFGSFDGFKVLCIPYQGRKLNKNFSMYFFLPNEKDGLKNLVEKFNTYPRFLQQNLNLREVRLDEFWIPKFKFSFHFDVSSVMKDMGEPLTFLQNPKDWSDMMHIPEDVPIMKPNMIQKAYIEVDEKGTEAAAITIMVGCGCAFMSPPKTESFVADHPFMFMIKEETSNSVFFTGAVASMLVEAKLSILPGNRILVQVEFPFSAPLIPLQILSRLYLVQVQGCHKLVQIFLIALAWIASLVEDPCIVLSPVGMAAAMAGMYSMSTYVSDMGVRTDIIKPPVEDLASFCIYFGECRVVHFVGTNTIGSSSSIVRCSSRLTSTSISHPSVCPEFLDCGFQQPKSGVVLSCLDCFLAGDSLYRFEYGVPTYHLLFKLRGCTCTTAKSDPPELVNHRALYLLRHGFLDYNTLSNNREHFAMYCKTGLLCIIGGLIGQASALKAPFYATGTCAALKWLIPGALIVNATAAVLTHLTSRYIDDLGVRSDDSGSERPLVVKLPVDDLSTFCASGTSGRSSFRAGKKTSYDKQAATSFPATGKMMIQHPEGKWAQRLDKVYITAVLLSDAKYFKVNLEPDGRFTFSTSARVENHLYGVKLSLYDKVNLKGGQINQGKRSIFFVIMKMEKKWWKKLVLLRGDEKIPHNVKVDWEKWLDEEDDDFGKSDEHEELAKSEEEDLAEAGKILPEEQEVFLRQFLLGMVCFCVKVRFMKMLVGSHLLLPIGAALFTAVEIDITWLLNSGYIR